jgi:hypothetical protein
VTRTLYTEAKVVIIPYAGIYAEGISAWDMGELLIFRRVLMPFAVPGGLSWPGTGPLSVPLAPPWLPGALLQRTCLVLFILPAAVITALAGSHTLMARVAPRSMKSRASCRYGFTGVIPRARVGALA